MLVVIAFLHNMVAFVLDCVHCLCVRLQALAEQQKAQQLAQQQQAGAPQVAAAPGQAQPTAAGQAQAQVPQAAAVAGPAAVPNAAVLVRIKKSFIKMPTVCCINPTLAKMRFMLHRLEP